jgi:hypothetical protein
MNRSSRWVEAALVLVAIAVRIATVLVLQSHEVPRSTYEHGEIAANLLAGRGFSVRFLGAEGPTSQQAPVYPWMVAAAYAVGGVETPLALLCLQVAQGLLGGLMTAGVIRLARRLVPASPLVAWGAGLIAALHPTLVYSATHVQVASVAAVLVVWLLELSARGAEVGTAGSAAAAGALLGVLALTDPILALGGLGMLASFHIDAPRGVRHLGRTLRLGLVALAVASLVVLPWTIRNFLVHGELVAIKSTFGYAFWQGNCALSEGTDKVVRPSVNRALRHAGPAGGLANWNRTLWEARHTAGYLDDIALSPEDYRQLAALSEPARSRLLFRRALNDLAQQPGRYLGLCLRRLRYFWLFDETNPKSRVLVYRVSHLGLTALAVISLAVAGGEVRRRLVPSLIVAACLAAFHSLTIVSARFHVPIEPLMAIWAASGLTRFDRPLLGVFHHPRRLTTSKASGS